MTNHVCRLLSDKIKVCPSECNIFMESTDWFHSDTRRRIPCCCCCSTSSSYGDGVVAQVLNGHVHVPGSELVLVVVLPQVLLQSLWDWKVAYVAIGLQLVAHGTTCKCLE